MTQQIEALKSTLSEDQMSVFDALEASRGPWTHNERIRLQLMRFPNGFAELGQEVKCSLADEIDYRLQFVGKPMPKHCSGEMKKRKNLQPLEVGIAVEMDDYKGLVVGGRKKEDVTAVTWIFLDNDSGKSGVDLRKCLDALELAYIFAESSTSRLAGDSNPILKWHCFLPLLQPKKLADRKAPGVSDVDTAEAAARWWGRVHGHVARNLLALGGLDYDDEGDKSSDRIVQGHYVPHKPDGSVARSLGYPAQGGRLLDLDKFLAATGFDEVEPPVVRLEDIEQPRLRAARDLDAMAAAGTAGDNGPTVGETSGSLCFKALSPLSCPTTGRRLVGKYDQSKDGYEVLCPWRHTHNSAVKAGTENDYSDSTMIFMSGKDGRSGGFSCFHGGCAAAAGQGQAVSTREILKWAREQGNTSIPDKPGWGGCSVMLDTPEPEVEAAPLPPTPSTSFAMAPDVEEEPPRPTHSSASALPDRAERMVIEINMGDLQGMIDHGIEALAGGEQRPGHPSFFKASVGAAQALVELVETPGRVPYIRPSKALTLAPKIQQVSKWVLPTDSADHQGRAPLDRTIKEILAAGSYPGMRSIAGIIGTPAFHADGVILQTPGYNPSMGVLYHPTHRVPLVSPDPCLATLREHKARLLDVLRDYPFKRGEEDLCRAVWVSAIFTRLLRTTFRGNVPMFIVSSGDRGSGKGKLIDAATIISDGVTAETVGFAADEAENERIIGMILKNEAPVVVIDNIRGVLASTSYEQFLTTPSFSTREIGASKGIKKDDRNKGREQVGGLADTLFWANGTGLVTGGDMSRRVLRIDIDDTSGSPQDRRVTPGREGLVDWVRQNRARLLEAALTLCAGYFSARRRGYRVQLPTFASFEAWSIVREVVVWMGLPDPILARGKAATDDTDTSFNFFVENLLSFGVADKELPQINIVKTLIDDNKTKAPKHSGFYNSLAEASKIKMKDVDEANRQLGEWLAKYKYIGRTYKAPDGRRWKLDKRRTKAGWLIGVWEQKD